jgi:hypothetical protein
LITELIFNLPAFKVVPESSIYSSWLKQLPIGPEFTNDLAGLLVILFVIKFVILK